MIVRKLNSFDTLGNTNRPTCRKSLLHTSPPPRPRLTLLSSLQPAVDVASEMNAAAQFEAELVEQMSQLRRYALRLCNDASLAEDLIQDALLNAWMARDRFEAGTNLKAWCTTILRNVFFSYKRRSWRMLPLADEAMANLPSRTADGGAALDLLAVRNAMSLLPQEQREALLLVGAGGMSYCEAAEICRCAIGTVKSRVSRARLRLAALISENRAGFNSDPKVASNAALNDLLEQVVVITSREWELDMPCASISDDAEVESDPALSRIPMLETCEPGNASIAGQ